MQDVLLVLETDSHLKPMLVKALKFLPEKITVMLFSQDNQVIDKEALLTQIDGLVKGQCKTKLLVELADSNSEKEQKLSAILTDKRFDMTVLYRPRIGKEDMNLGLIMTVMHHELHSAVLLCGDIRWRLPIKLLGTLDVFEPNSAHQALNQEVLKILAELAGKVKAEIEVLSVIPISRLKTEFDITDEDEVLVKKEKAAKAKLEKVLQTTDALTDVSMHISAGSPPCKIASVASKHKVNLVVMGNVARTGITGLLLGNTAEKMLSRLGVDALIVRH